MLERVKNPVFIAAAASLLYQVLSKYGLAPTLMQYQLFIDLLSYLLIGAGVYSQFDANKKQEGESK